QFSSHAIRFLGGKQAAPTPLRRCASVLQRLPVLRDLGANRVLGAPASSLSLLGASLEPAARSNGVRDAVDLPTGLQPDDPGGDEAVPQGINGGIRIPVEHRGDAIQFGKDSGGGDFALVL